MKILLFQDESDLLKRLCLSEPFGPAFIQWLETNTPFSDGHACTVLPEQWLQETSALTQINAHTHHGDFWDISNFQKPLVSGDIHLFNAGYLLKMDPARCRHILDSIPWDIALIQVCPDLQPSREVLKLTPHNQVVGYRRFYTVTTEPTDIPGNWPHVVALSARGWQHLTQTGRFPLNFRVLMDTARTLDLTVISLKTGGSVIPLNHRAGLLNCLDMFEPNGTRVPAHCRAVGTVFADQTVTFEPNVRLIGPVVLSRGVHLKAGTVIRRSIVGENITVDNDMVVNNRVYLEQEETEDGNLFPNRPQPLPLEDHHSREFRHWAPFSYVRFGKRIFDVIVSLLVLILLIPVFPIVILMIKLTSPGPVFYKARRQGFHGKDFNCLKFRTMMLKADSIQERLRVVNQVDGPQFKIDNDPRISGVGKFLRDTCIDELPQFINVLLGQMSVVGPRPSPENENDSCPVWRDARLSVRPGITGLWQVCRTRQTGSDFQEWVYYDTRYVRNLSFRKDLWICWKTAKKLIHEFLGQFG